MQYFWKPLSIKENVHNVWVWSDLHLGHNRDFLYKPRDFSSVEDHDRGIREAWNSVCDSDSIMFLLGDSIFGQSGEERLIKFLNSVNFKTLYLMAGNHAAGYKQLLAKSDSQFELNLGHKKIVFLPNYIEFYLEKQPFVLSHYPILSFNGQGKGVICLHGHCHGKLYENNWAKEIYNGKVMDVGVENCPKPVNMLDISRKFSKIESITYDHHNSKTQNPF